MLWEYGVNWMEAECIATPLTQVNYSKSSQKTGTAGLYGTKSWIGS